MAAMTGIEIEQKVEAWQRLSARGLEKYLHRLQSRGYYINNVVQVSPLDENHEADWLVIGSKLGFGAEKSQPIENPIVPTELIRLKRVGINTDSVFIGHVGNAFEAVYNPESLNWTVIQLGTKFHGKVVHDDDIVVVGSIQQFYQPLMVQYHDPTDDDTVGGWKVV